MDDLKRGVAAGDSAAFAELYDAIADPLFHYLVTQTGTREDAADVLQETFVRIFRSRERLIAGRWQKHWLNVGPSRRYGCLIWCRTIQYGWKFNNGSASLSSGRSSNAVNPGRCIH